METKRHVSAQSTRSFCHPQEAITDTVGETQGKPLWGVVIRGTLVGLERWDHNVSHAAAIRAQHSEAAKWRQQP